MAIFSGSSLNDLLSGSKLSDWVAGLAGNDTLIGGPFAFDAGGADTLDGGTGADSLVGGTGNDAYVIDSIGDKISETGGDADDRILASINIDLTASAAAYAGIEHVTLTGSSALNAAGNGSANMLIGNSGANHLDGKAGADTMLGGDGNDAYEVDKTSDKVIEFANGGIDQVNSSVSFTLGAGVENLTFTGGVPGGVLFGNGNELANKITGNAADDILNGLDGNDTLIGNGGSDVLDGGTGADSMVGGAGNDVYVVDDLGDKIAESGSDAGDAVSSFFTFTLGATLESLFLQGSANLDGTGNSSNNLIDGNSGDNVLSGLGGDDQFNGGAGNDLMLGGDGKDILFNGPGLDTMVGGAGIDEFSFFQTQGLTTIADLNGLPGGDKIDIDPDLLIGFTPGVSKVDDFLKVTTLNGSTLIQLDSDGTTNGASFADMAVLQGMSTDMAGLLANGVLTRLGIVLAASTSPFQGGAGADNHAGTTVSDLMFGLAGNDTLTGDAGADTLDGGTGADSLVGGDGNDTYVIDNAGDKISEIGAEIDDRILTSISIDLTANAVAYAGIEHVTLTGTSALNATGNAGANMLIGNDGANILDGAAGNDTMIGGAGNDTYKVDSSADVVVELPGGGIDTVLLTAGGDFTLSGGTENLTVSGGAFSFVGGNDLANQITGNAGEDRLIGQGGNDTLIGNDGDDELDGVNGADSMAGGAGDDIYRVDDAGDKIAESGPSTDADKVLSAITYTLGANLEELDLLASDTIDGTGNSLNNIVTGNIGNNVLSGVAGDDSMSGGDGDDLLLGGDGSDTLAAAVGSDTLIGGAGSDRFKFSSAGVAGLDTIADFNALPLGDQLDLSGLITTPSAGSESLFIQTVTAGGSTTVRVDQDGLGGKFAFVDVAVLMGVTTDFQGLLANGAIAGLATGPTPAFQGGAGADTHDGTGISDLMFGLAGNDILTGNAGADTLDGGVGSDSLTGGAGNDTYVIDSAGDRISETGAELDDRIQASISIDLTVNAIAYANIEHVTLTGSAALNVTGNGAANMLIGNSSANILDGAAGNDTLVGGAGNDTYKIDSAKDVVIELPGGGVDTELFAASALSFVTLGANVENLTMTGVFSDGTGNDLANKMIADGATGGQLHGLGGNDTLIGNSGSHQLDGGAGADSMTGGTGTDTYFVDDVGDKVTESGPSTDVFDTVKSSVTYTLGANLERLDLLGSAAIDGSGNSLNNLIVGSAGNNVLSGLAGDDALLAGAGADLLLGGDGNDLLEVDDGADTAVGGAGHDTFQFIGLGLDGLDVIADFTGGPGGDVIDVQILLGGFDFKSDNINQFLKTSTANGNTVIQADKDGTANGVNFVDMVVLQGISTDLAGLLTSGNLLLSPFAGAETLKGGTGVDSLVGDLDNDTYIVDNAGDRISDPGGADDRILASINIDLLANAAAFAGIEHVTLTGSAALNATGNGGANMLIGNSGANHLDGKGGNDTMLGGDGNDTYEVDSTSDKVIEFANGGIDQANSSVNFTLGTAIENLVLTGSAFFGEGNDLANKMTAAAGGSQLLGLGGNDTLIGNDGQDFLDGGTGADSMVGGTGIDTYFVDDVGDKVVESGPSTEVDAVVSTITYTLGANIEQLALTGSASIDGTGNSLDNILSGNSGDNILRGLGGSDRFELEFFTGTGKDTLVGGDGSDTFEFTTSSPTGLSVTIADLNGLPGGDKIDLAVLTITGFDPGFSDPTEFVKTKTANGNTVIQVDFDGTANGASFLDWVVLQGVSTDLDGLLANGVLIADGEAMGVAPTKAFSGGSGADSHAGVGLSELMFGLAGNDTLTGNGGADTLDGGTGTDLLVGGDGNDTYVIDNAGDKITEIGAELDDRILASINIDLTANAVAYAGIEHVTLTGTSALNATGNDGANMLIGNSGANHLDGRSGSDTLIGGDGNDVYEVGGVGLDLVIELPGGGIDQVNSSGNFTIKENIENLTLTGASQISGQGNDLANTITGNAASNGLLGQGGNDTLIGNDGNDGLDGGTGADSMVGGAGLDTYTVDNAGDKVMESGPSTDTNDTVQSFITYTLGANIETLVQLGSANIDGTGNNLENLLSGNSADNVLSGLAGADIINGGLGNDLLLGGDGNDTLLANIDSDTLIGGAGVDEFDFLNFSVKGLDTVADLNAFPGGDKIDVTSLMPSFVAGSSKVSDFLKATTANGSTLLQVDADGTANGVNFVDMVILQGLSTDLDGLLANGVLVRAGAVLAPPPTTVFQGGAGGDNQPGTALSDLMLGLAGNDTLVGNAGADTLDGGTGTDFLTGGTGNDTYVIDNAGDRVSEFGGDADDRILASISIDLTAKDSKTNIPLYENIEHVTLIGSAALNATGNGLGNMLIGNDGANILDGAAGNDTLIGGAGNDTYKVDSTDDAVIELPGGGVDTVLSTAFSFTLDANIENLTLTGDNAANAVGNDLGNKITNSAAENVLIDFHALFGNGGNDTLIGNAGADHLFGGTGADSMAGGAGDDLYEVDDVGDKVMESGSSTDDGVNSSITYTLGANLEFLELEGSANIDGTGNGLDNNIFVTGNSGDNVLSGLGGNDTLFAGTGNDLLLGGDGNDVLQLDIDGGFDTEVGGAGSDTFHLSHLFALAGLDVIADFTGGPGGDVIDLGSVLSGFDFASDNINDFVRTSTANGNTTIQLDQDGTANGVNFTDVVVLEGVSTDLAGLVTNGNLILE